MSEKTGAQEQKLYRHVHPYDVSPQMPRCASIILKNEPAHCERLLHAGKDWHRKLRDRVQGIQEGTCIFFEILFFPSFSKRFRLGSFERLELSIRHRSFVCHKIRDTRIQRSRSHNAFSYASFFSSPYNSPEGKYTLSPETR